MRDDRLYLIHIDECIVRIERYTTAGREAFLSSELVQDAVLRNLQILTESTQRLSAELKAAHAEVDWRGLAGFRNVLVHNYLNLNVNRVWEIVEREVPILKQQIASLLSTLSDQSS
jgi:uncharacterized protein with HEPN domain